ncbi:MAG: thiamine pyrophosphate-dependent dehydrogenase E1 component subunit alpha [Planctomycetota bacterium]|nr:thiamine pyrophosphate-dependent dehydrogenase E1 component subunit alpha [Planctomycetota bacterium]
MKRYKAYDPPEYLQWQPDPDVMSSYHQKVEEPDLDASVIDLGAEGLKHIYQGLVRARLHDITLKRWVRTGVITKAWLGCGEEAVTVGACHALKDGDVVGPMIRNAAATFERGIPIEESFGSYLATGDGITKGRDLHFGDLAHGVVAPISHVGDLVPVCSGFALAFQLEKKSNVALTWVGDGATRTGAVHEGLSMAASRSLPLIVIVEDNVVALGTLRDERLDSSLTAMAGSYGAVGLECDGNHVLDVHAKVSKARDICLEDGGPVIILARTFRFGGHATHDEAEARDLFDQEVFDYWARREPIGCFEEWLKDQPGVLGGDPVKTLESLEDAVVTEVEAAAEKALQSQKKSLPDVDAMLGDVFAT